MGINLDVIGDYDVSLDDGGALAQVRRTLAAAVQSGDAFIVSDLWTMVERIRRRLGSGQKMRRLRIFGHATPGVQCVGRWRGSPIDLTTGQRRLGQGDYERVIMVIRGQLFNDTILAQLNPYFDRGGFAELHGCAVARGTAGEELLRKLAQLWQVPVKGGREAQRTGGGLEAPAVGAWPNGHIEPR